MLPFEVNQLTFRFIIQFSVSVTFWYTCWVVLKWCYKVPSNSSIWNNWSDADASSPSFLLTLFLQDPPFSSPIEQTMLTYKFMYDFTLPIFKMATIFRWNKIFIIRCVWFMPSYSTNTLPILLTLPIHSQKHYLTHHIPTLLNLVIILYPLPITLPHIAEGLEDGRFEMLGKSASFIFLSSVLKT